MQMDHLDRVIFIMAQGDQSRWDHPEVQNKHFIPLGSETIITRTIRMLRGYYVVVVCVSDYCPRLELISRMQIHELMKPTLGLLRGIWLTLKDFPKCDRQIVLLGDVVFSNKMLEIILEDQRDFGLFGRHGQNQRTGKEVSELFALTLHKSFRDQFMDWAFHAWMSDPQKYRLWDVYKQYPNMLSLRGDYTDDCDNIQEYEKFYPKLECCALEDDAKWRMELIM